MALGLVGLAAFAGQAKVGLPTTVMRWEFPRTGSCHEGLPFADGITGVFVWGGGDTINLTVGRADLWDHRGGYPWTAEQSYTNIMALVSRNDQAGLKRLFSVPVPERLKGRGFAPADKSKHGFVWRLPADEPAALDASVRETESGSALFVRTARGKTPIPALSAAVGFAGVAEDSREYWRRSEFNGGDNYG